MTARSEVPASFRSSSVRPGPLELIQIGLRDVLSRRRLIAYLVRADMKKRGADTLLGNVWWVVDPLLQMLVYVVLVSVILQRGRYEDFPLFIFAAILPWKWFTTTVGDGLNTVVTQERLIKQIYFPKIVLPVSAAVAEVTSFLFGLIPLFALTILFFPHRASAWMLLIPVVAAVQFLFSLGFAIGLSAINVFYRDVANLSRHLFRFWFYLSPSLYGVDMVESLAKEHRVIGIWFAINPWTYLFSSYRNLIYYGQPPDWAGLAAVTVGSIVLLALAVLLFKRVEPTFAKVL